MLDKEFLKQLMEHRNRTIHARITALTMAELPVETVEGSVTGGSISIDGTSAVRRTCSLSLIGKKSVITDIHWAIRNKFKLEIGVENTINQEYDDIIWFKQGIYGITSFSYSESSNSCTISIQGKDKMAYLDGTFGGNITAQTDFGKWDEIDAEGNVTTYDQLIYNIIRNILHEFAGEPYQNIVIQDLDQFGYELWEYRGDKEYPMYYFYDIEENKFVNATINGDMEVVLVEGEIKTNLKSLVEDELYQYAMLKTGKKIYLPGDKNKHEYYISKIEYGEVAGYHKTGLIFAGELVGNPGETVVTILDKIKNMLGAFEYFYDLDGRFRFKKQDNYIYGSLSPLSSEAKDILAATANQKISYNFEGNSMVSSISNSPGIAELKNDFVVWGIKKSAAGGEIPIHARYAVCRKPQSYKTFDYYTRIYPCYIGTITHQGEEKQPLDIQPYIKSGNDYAPVRWRKGAQYVELIQGMLEPTNGDTTIYVPNNGRYIPWDNNTTAYYKDELGFHAVTLSGNLTHGEYYILTDASRMVTSSDYDWRELLYLMARDYYQHHEFPSYTLDLINRGCLEGKTGYEPFYADLQAFWRQLYNPLTIAEANKEFVQTSSSLATYVNLIKKPIGDIPIEDRYNGYVEETNVDDTGKSFNYLRPLSVTTETSTEGYYLLNQNTPGALSEVADIISGGVIKVLKDDAVEDAANPNCYTYVPKFYKVDDSFYPVDGGSDWPGWSKDAVLSPESLIFWIDFLDTAGSIGEYSIQNIGHRPKVEPSDQMIKTIYNRATPSIEFVVYPDKIDPDDQVGQTLQLSPLQINQSMEAAFTISSQGLAAADKIDELVYKHLCQAEGVSMTTIPVYYLEPNSVIYAESDNVNVQGNYLVTQMSIPLAYNGTMSITAHKLVKYIK